MISDLLYIHNILESINLIESYIKEKSFKEFSESELIIDAVSKRLEEIGENAKKVSDRTKKKYKEVKWAEFIENRNFLTHVYQLVNKKRLWLIIKKDLIVLKRQIQKIKKELENEKNK